MRTGNSRIFYGWFIIVAVALGMCFGYVGTIIYAFSSFVLPLTEEFGWSRGAISLGLTMSNITMMASAPIIGMLIDKKGVKWVLLPSTVLFGTVLCSFYFLTGSLWHFYLLMITLTALGSGTASIAYVRLLVTWFDKKKGLALALGTSGAGIAAILLPPLVGHVIQTAGWRDAYLLLGGINLIFVVPLIFFVIHNTPAMKGMYPDGAAPRAELDKNAVSDISVTGFSFQESIHRPVFWKLALATLLLGMALTGAISQLVPLLVERGIPRAGAGKLASLVGVSIIISRLITGYLLDRFHAPFIAGIILIFPVVGFAALALAPSDTVAALTIVSIGIGLGLEFDALGYFCTQYFGRVALGKIYGLLFVIFNIGGGVGVFFSGHSFDYFSSYTVALLGGACVTSLALLFTVSLGKYPDFRTQGAAARGKGHSPRGATGAPSIP